MLQVYVMGKFDDGLPALLQRLACDYFAKLFLTQFVDSFSLLLGCVEEVGKDL